MSMKLSELSFIVKKKLPSFLYDSALTFHHKSRFLDFFSSIGK